MNFLYEASDFEDNTENDLSKQTPEYIKKRFIAIADKFWKAGVHPLEFKSYNIICYKTFYCGESEKIKLI